MPQVSDFQHKAWLLHRREIGLMCQPIILLIISSLWGYKARNGRLADTIVLLFTLLSTLYLATRSTISMLISYSAYIGTVTRQHVKMSGGVMKAAITAIRIKA